ncbi:leucine-rich repeat-containing protein 53 [Xiphophorus couchianus]|uniref:leucine-rich repeat-containing protein 53 n=1 Tax=Xiphophorus couchianus TaxID=32473 RepID=UPI0010169A34|nr:leucine-rich repeat-containing protein 53 [Xiphophorus couchianus]XP_027877478.1 leucine-rich repeat-containing protein 53 [Xiphophorus couchianus]
MTCVLLMFLLPVVEAQRVPACPVSCAVCSEDAVICQRLADIIDAANSTQALLLTEGSISVVQPASLSDLRNITVIGLSSNHISELSEDAFRNLPFLHTLLLDHNLLTSQALQGGALINLSQLEVLALGHNHIDMIQAGWFTGTKALLSLKLEGNLVTRLNPGSFPLNDFRSLETLDLSDNLIDFLDRNSFRGLVSLRSLDLSRNRLSSVPPEAFSYLVWLSNLNLDLNSWNCTCELLELAAVLTSFIQEPDKALYNGRRMMCVSADNPAVTTVLELTEANCVPSNQNITVQIEARGSVAPRQYARDLAIAAVICFLGGVALTLLAVLICYHVSQRKKKKKKGSQRPKEELNKGRTTANHVDQLGDRERMRDFVLQANSSQQWSKESMTLNERMDHHRDTFKSRAEENGSNVHCPHCNTNGKMPDQMRKGKWLNGGPEAGDVQERRKLRMMVEEERRRQQNYSWNVSNKVPPHIADSSFHLLRETSDNLPPYKADGDMGNPRTDEESKSRRYETSHCRNCHRTFRPEENMTHRMPHSNQMDIYDFNGKVRRELFRKMNTELKRETKNVKFDLTRSRTNRGEESLEEEEQEEATSRGNEKSSDRRHKVQSSRLMKVKLNLNPLRKSKVHPRKKNEHGHTKNTSSKRSKEKRRHGKGEEEEGEEKSGKRAKSSREKKRKSSKTEKADEGEQKSSTSKRDKSAEGDQKKNPNISQPPDGDTVSAQDLQTLQYQSAGLALGGAQLAFQHPFSFSPADRTRSTNLSLLNSPGSLLTGSTLSLQAGKALLNTMSSGSNPLLTHGLVNPIAPGVTLSGLNIAPGGATESFARLPAVSTRSSNPPLLAKTIQVNPLQAGGNPPAPFLTSTSDGSVLSLANPANDPVALGYSQMQVDSSAFVAAPKLDLTHSQDIQTGKGPIQSTTESQAPSTKDDLPEQDKDETLGDTSETRVEKMSVNMPPEGVAQTEGPQVGGSEERLKADSMSVMDQSAPSLSIPDESSPAAGGAALLQQEYLSEDGGSSPRRKLRLVLPEKTSNRPPTALERKIL